MGWFSKPEPEQVMVKGQPLQCHTCHHDRFTKREAQLSTAAAALVNLDWTDETATCFVCANCGYIHWFIPSMMR